MSRATPKMRDFAERLIAYETSRNKSSKTKIPAAFFVGEKLRPHSAALMGDVALALANAEVPWLRAVHVKSDGSFEGLDELEAQVDPEDYDGLTTGTPTRTGPRPAQKEEAAPEPKAKK